MCSAITNGLTQVTSRLWNVTTQVSTHITNSYACLGRHIERLTNDQLPTTAAKVVQQAFYSLPYTVGALVAYNRLPVSVTFPLVVGYAALHIYHDSILPEKSYTNLWHGLGNARMYLAIQNTAQFVVTKNPLFAVSTVINLLFSRFCHRHAEQITSTHDEPIVIQHPRTPVSFETPK